MAACRLRPTVTKVYANAVPDAFGLDCDFAVLHKIYGKDSGDERTYSPAKCIGTRCENVVGNPDPKHISTLYVERQNLTMRMSMRRFTRLTNAFSKKVENHSAAVALYFMWYILRSRASDAARDASDGSTRNRSRLDG